MAGWAGTFTSVCVLLMPGEGGAWGAHESTSWIRARFRSWAKVQQGGARENTG